MSKVYVLISEPPDYDIDRYVMGVFSTTERATAWIRTNHPEYLRFGFTQAGEPSYSIEEHDLDDN